MAMHAMPREEIFALRQAIARIEGKSIHAARMAAGRQEMPDGGMLDASGCGQAGDRAGYGFEDLLAEACQPGAMTEIRSRRLGEAGAASGFAMGLALSLRAKDAAPVRYLMIADPMVVREAGLAYAPGLADFGFQPRQLIHAMPRSIEDALWLAEAALGCGAFTAVLLEVHGNSKRFGLTESRRLALKARGAGASLILIRQAGEEEASSASIRLRVEPAPAAARRLTDGSMLGGSVGNPVFRIVAEKSRSQVLSEFLVEWNPHDRRLFAIAAADAEQHDGRPPYSGALPPPTGNRPAGAQALGHVLAFERAS